MGKTINIYNNFDNHKIDQIMASVQDFNTALERINTGLAGLANLITELKGQINGGGLNASDEDAVLQGLNNVGSTIETILNPAPVEQVNP